MTSVIAREISALIRLWREGLSAELIAEELSIGRLRVLQASRELGLPRRCAPPWSASEDALLRQLAPTHTVVMLAGRLPGRTIHGIKRRADRLGIQIYRKRALFTPGEDAVIRARFGVEPVRSWMHLLPGRSADNITNRANLLGLRSGLWARSKRDRLEHHQSSKCLGKTPPRRGASFRPGGVRVVGVHSRPPP